MGRVMMEERHEMRRKRRNDEMTSTVCVDGLEAELAVSPQNKKTRWTSPVSEVFPVMRPTEAEVLHRSLSTQSASEVTVENVDDDEEDQLTFLEPDMSNDMVVSCAARYLQSLVDQSEGAEAPRIGASDPISVFFSAEKQKFQLEAYVRRVVGLVNGSSSLFFASLCYMNRMAEADSRLVANAYNVHRLWITAVVLASKVLEDEVYSNEHYARMGGVPTLAEMNKLEACMLNKLSFRMHISPEEHSAIRSAVLA